MPSYRNNRKTFYTEKTSDTLSVGTIVQVLKSDQNSFEHNFVPTNVPNNGGSTKYEVMPGDANVENNPEFQYPGYLYCDGTEYNINEYPALFAAIGNLYGGTAATGVTQDNIWSMWPGSLGTFKVPDFKAKRLVGNGPVYGLGTASVGESDLGVGPQTIGGKWYLDEAGQKKQFTLGNVTTTGYELVTDTIPADIVGTQTVTVNLEEKRLNGPPQHSHFLLHSEASQDVSQPRKGSGDFYIRGYKNTKGKISNYSAIGGIALTHRHILSKKAFTDTSIATYDTYNFAGGDAGAGTIKEEGFYFASGGLGAGNFENKTTVDPPVFKKFTATSLIGGRLTQILGTPEFTFTQTLYSNPGSYTFNMPTTGWDVLTLFIIGGSGSGSVSNNAGNNGGESFVMIGTGGNPSNLLNAVSGGGIGGGAASGNSGGGAGAAGTTSSSGTLISGAALTALSPSTVATSNGTNATAGQGGQVYIASIPGWTPSGGASLPSGSIVHGQGGQSASGTSNIKKGSNGAGTFTSSQPTTGPTTYTSNQNVQVTWSPSQAKLKSMTWTLRGARGGNAAGSATGGPGHILGLSYKDSALVSFGNGTSFTVTCGKIGSVPAGGSNPTALGSGGNGGPPSGGGTNGAGGGSATVLSLNTEIIAGAGGGGGAGGKAGGGPEGKNGNSANASIDATSGNLFGGAGKNGGAGGCNGGGGGGGGGGIDANASAAGGGPGGDAGSNSSQSGAGARGMSGYKTTKFNSPTTDSTTHTGEGSATLTYQVEASFYGAAGGGGGQAKLLTVSIPKEAAEAVGQSTFSSLSVKVGLGGSGVTAGGGASAAGDNGEVLIKTGKITSYSGGQSIISVGDIVKLASDGIQLYSSGLGTGTTGGFKLPTTQAPTIDMEPISGGNNATATATVSNDVVSGVTLVTGGSGYTAGVNVRFLGGAGSGTKATTTKTATGVINSLTLTPGSSEPYIRYLRFQGPELERFIILQPQNCTTVKRFTVKACRGNNVNGGEKPDNGDELKLYFNTDGSNTFPSSGYLGILVPIPTEAEITSNYDGNGSGAQATKWYSYSILLPTTAQVDGVQFKIVQERAAASSANDNGGDTDHFGICDFIYENKATTKLEFVPTEGKISTAGDMLSFTVDGDPKAFHTSGMAANDVKFTLSSSVPLLPSATIDPDINIVLLEPYFLVKHLIKAF